MSGRNKASAKPVQAEEIASRPEPRFTVSKLAENSRELFGVSACTFAAATCGVRGKFTIKEMREHLEKWCKKEVK